MYASFREISDALHLGIFRHPPGGKLFDMLRSVREIPELRLIQVTPTSSSQMRICKDTLGIPLNQFWAYSEWNEKSRGLFGIIIAWQLLSEMRDWRHARRPFPLRECMSFSFSLFI
jgi:hypothetical protein